MNLSDSDNDTLIASCFDFIDINDDTNDSDDNDDYDGIHRDYSYHTTNNIQQYFKSNNLQQHQQTTTRSSGHGSSSFAGHGIVSPASKPLVKNGIASGGGFISDHIKAVDSKILNNNHNNNNHGSANNGNHSQESSASELSDLDDSDEDIFGLLSNQTLPQPNIPINAPNVGVVGQRRRNIKQQPKQPEDEDASRHVHQPHLKQPQQQHSEIEQPVVHHPTVAELLVANKSKSLGGGNGKKDQQKQQHVNSSRGGGNKDRKEKGGKYSNNNNNNNKKSSSSNKTKDSSDSSFGGIKILKRDSNIDSDQLNKLFSGEGDNSSKNLKDSGGGGNGQQKKDRRSRNRKQQQRDHPSSSGSTTTATPKNGKDTSSSTSTSTTVITNEKLLKEQEREKRKKDEKTLGRVMGEAPIHYDLDSVAFSASNTFVKGEIVLVPRSRGGFNYGKVYDVIQSNQCHHDQSVQHPGVQYRAVYPSGSKKDNMFKDLNSSYLGKLIPIDKVSLDSAKSFTLQLQPDGRNIGQKAALKDLQNIVFSPSTRFHSNQIALIPRSKGGFTYGHVLKECKVPCKVGDIKHEVRGYRVIVEKKETITVKDLIVGNIGQIFVAQPVQQVQQQQAAVVVQQQQPTNVQNKEKEKEKPKHQHQQQRQQLRHQIQDEIDEADEENDLDDDDDEEESESEESEQEEESESESESNSDDPSDESLESDQDSDEEEILWNGESTTSNQSLSMVGSPSTLASPKLQPTAEPITPPSSQLLTSTTSTSSNNSSPAPMTSSGLAAVQLPLNLPLPGSRGVIEMPQDSIVFVGGKSKKKPYLVVIDGPNVAIKYSNKKNSLSVIAIKKALDYYSHRGYEAVTFLPESVVSRKQTGPNAPMRLADFQPMIDNHQLLQELIEKGQICITPPQDYDDSYAIQYAKKTNALIITNDRYNDHINNQPTEAEKKKSSFFAHNI
ncbi:hypothetical protein DFA_04642 [Cavenderia fasciculata]|uniref:RNase NYN domain-containing protein n=1 Tax=Cavenderia fasciculata TaxID=261658 RepID=F4PQ51_CACFS|nr:uncharacterized protein DFA_04642 [Cavenderia fasciculata]EGG22514.1 hypothetical protein DFA_04642 [Cavenderia fasciculata]|eukprot:XP_004360365.1 hypothetical protein DFA_04642 [Cavenderia fasciculata]